MPRGASACAQELREETTNYGADEPTIYPALVNSPNIKGPRPHSFPLKDRRIDISVTPMPVSAYGENIRLRYYSGILRAKQFLEIGSRILSPCLQDLPNRCQVFHISNMPSDSLVKLTTDRD